MVYSNFTLSKVKEDFQLSIIEGVKFLPATLSEIIPSQILKGVLEDLPWAIVVDTEKARWSTTDRRSSEVIINPVLLEVRRIFEQRISVFSGEEFNVDASLGLNGVCDFLISGSKEQLSLEAPAIVVVVEAKKSDLKSGMGQYIAEMIAAQQFNSNDRSIRNTIKFI